MKKKGQQKVTLGALVGIVTVLAVAVLVMTFGTDVTENVRQDFEAEDGGFGCAQFGANCTGAAYNVSSNGLTGLLNVSGQLGNIGTVIGAAVIIGILVAAFAFAGIGGVRFG